MGSLQKRSKDVFRMDIIDENGTPTGEFIEMNLADVELPFKISNAIKNMELAKENTIKITKEINDREDMKGEFLESKNAEDIMLAWREYYIKIREYFDSFLGEGACFKFFGETNYAGMEDDLFEALMPNISEMDITVDNMYKRIQEKYSTESIDVL